MMRLAAWLSIVVSAPAWAQAIVVSPGPNRASVTVYRDPNGGGELNLNWLQGFALVSETRRVAIPAGESELRFAGVTAGLIPQSAVVDGLGPGVIEKNRDAKLLSPGTLLDAYLGRRVQLRRTSHATGEVREQEAVVRASAGGVVIETEAGIEALRCTGLDETLTFDSVPATLAAKPTLSVKVRSERPIETDVKLTYLSTGFDWRASYVATLAPDGRTLSLFAWLTLANGDETGFEGAQAMAVAGRLNREGAERPQPESRPIHIACWPQGRTHEIPTDELLVTSRRAFGAPPPPPPPPPAAERDGESIVVTGSRIMAEREALGDLKLYRIPIPVTVAANSQKQVALIEQPKARFESFYRWRSSFTNQTGEPETATRVLRLENRESHGLGLPLPAGGFTLYTEGASGLFLLGEGRMTDRAVGETVEVEMTEAPGIRMVQQTTKRQDSDIETRLTATNDQPVPARLEVRFDDEHKVLRRSDKLIRRDGAWWWMATIPANSRRSLTVLIDD